MSSGVEVLQQCLRELGATTLHDEVSATTREFTYQAGELRIRLASEYDAWRVTIAHGPGPFFPGSFWVAALKGEKTCPDPAVTDEDIMHVAERLPALIPRASILADQVELMGHQYSRAMKERYS